MGGRYDGEQALEFIRCGGKSYSPYLLAKWLSEPQSPHLLNGDNNTTALIGFTELNEVKHILAQYLHSNKL